MRQYPSVQVSPIHFVALHEDYLPMIKRAPSTDFVVRTLAKRMAGNMPLMSGDLVIASYATRQSYPLAAAYPLHFRKTYYPGSMYGDPRVEFERHTLASSLIEVSPPIGCTRDTFRSCLVPGTRFDKLFALGVEPEERNVAVALELGLTAAAGLWTMTERAFSTLTRLHEGGLCHGDAHWHNFIVCASPLSITPIDFERAETRESLDREAWQKRCQADRHQLLKLAVYLQCVLGRQRGPLAQQALDQLDDLVRPPETFRNAIDERTYGGPISG